MLKAGKLSKQEERYTYRTASRTCDNKPQIAVKTGEYKRIQGYANGEYRNIHKVYEIRRFRASLEYLHVRIDYDVIGSVQQSSNRSEQHTVYAEEIYPHQVQSQGFRVR